MRAAATPPGKTGPTGNINQEENIDLILWRCSPKWGHCRLSGLAFCPMSSFLILHEQEGQSRLPAQEVM